MAKENNEPIKVKGASASDITSKLWEMANKLRGTMDASEYKNYILPFMFYRYLSENQDDYLKVNHLEDFYEVEDDAEKEEYLEEISKGIGYAISPTMFGRRLSQKLKTTKSKPVTSKICLIRSTRMPNVTNRQKMTLPMSSQMSILAIQGLGHQRTNVPKP